MADGGFSKLWRKAFDHEYWTEKRVFSRWEAWMDCWANMAAFRDYKKQLGNSNITIKRGEFMAAERFLMQRWRWPKTRVHEFLEHLVAENMLLRVSTVRRGSSKNPTVGGSVYYVVNYELYQNSDPENRPTTDRPPTDHRPKRSKSKKIKIKNTTSPDGEGWVTKAGELWIAKFGGTASFGEIGAHLAPLVAKYGEAEVLAMWERYLGSGKVADQYKTPANFAQKYALHKQQKPQTVSTDDIKLCLHIAGASLSVREGRETAFANIEEKNPALWARTKDVLPKLDLTYLSELKGYDLNKAIENQLNGHHAA